MGVLRTAATIGQILRTAGWSGLSAAVVGAAFGCSGPALILLNAAASGGLSERQAASWLFAVYFFGGLIGVISSLRYRQPICGAYTIAGTVMLGPLLATYGLEKAAGAYLVAATALVLLGLSGLVEKAMRWLPLPVVLAMIAGTLLRFGTGIISLTHQRPLVGLASIGGYLFGQRLATRVPPILPALALGTAASLFLGQVNLGPLRTDSIFALPQVVRPSFDWQAILAISLPLVALILGGENAQAIGVLTAEGYRPPINYMTWVSGLGGIAAAFFGGHGAHMAGVMTAICASPDAGPREKRFAAAVLDSLFFALFGLFAGLAVVLVKAVPAELVGVLAGLAMVNVLVAALERAFAPGPFRLGAFFSLIIAMSGVSLAGLSPSFWALLGGTAVAMLTATRPRAVSPGRPAPARGPEREEETGSVRPLLRAREGSGSGCP